VVQRAGMFPPCPIFFLTYPSLPHFVNRDACKTHSHYASGHGAPPICVDKADKHTVLTCTGMFPCFSFSYLLLTPLQQDGQEVSRSKVDTMTALITN